MILELIRWFETRFVWEACLREFLVSCHWFCLHHRRNASSDTSWSHDQRHLRLHSVQRLRSFWRSSMILKHNADLVVRSKFRKSLCTSELGGQEHATAHTTFWSASVDLWVAWKHKLWSDFESRINFGWSTVIKSTKRLILGFPLQISGVPLISSTNLKSRIVGDVGTFLEILELVFMNLVFTFHYQHLKRSDEYLVEIRR